MNFRVGQKVVCVNARPGAYSAKQILIKGHIYEVERVHYPFLTLVGVEPQVSARGWYATRFRPVIERSTETGMAMLRPLLNSKPKRTLVPISSGERGE